MSEAGGWKSHFSASLFQPATSEITHLSQNIPLGKPLNVSRGWWFETSSIDGNELTFFLSSIIIMLVKTGAGIVGWGTQCLWGELRLIKRWQKDNYYFSGGWETSPMFHVPYLNWELAQITSTSAFSAGLATANPQLLRPQEHSLLRQDSTWSFTTIRTTFGGSVFPVRLKTVFQVKFWNEQSLSSRGQSWLITGRALKVNLDASYLRAYWEVEFILK